MPSNCKHLISINDLTNRQIEQVLDLAKEMDEALTERRKLDFCQGQIMATLFFEPSTRTRLSFETAMLRLGGQVISFADAQKTSSVAKGESLADTIRTVEKYAEIIVMRHPLDGSARWASEYISVPLISGGDGAHEHPTQTLCDLYTIQKEKGSIKGQHVALCGDLKHARTVHSLALALARMGAPLATFAPDGLQLPSHVTARLAEFKCFPRQYQSLPQVLEDESTILYQTQSGRSKNGRPRGTASQLANLELAIKDRFSALYFTRIQRERFFQSEVSDAVVNSYRINKELLAKAGDQILIMHPLPRNEELDYEVDFDKRAAYFRQVSNGVPVRMALILLLLGLERWESPPTKRPRVVRDQVDPCENPRCVTANEKGASPRFYRLKGDKRVVACFYCDWEKLLPVSPTQEDVPARR